MTVTKLTIRIASPVPNRLAACGRTPMIDCQLCPRVLPSGARCRACKRLICDVCVKEGKVPPDKPDDVDGYELLIYRPAYTGGDFFCRECRDGYASRCVMSYRQQSFSEHDPISWVAAVAATGIAFDQPEVDAGYDLASGWVNFARHQGLATISATRYLAAPAGASPDTDIVSGWLVEDGCTYSSSYSDPEYGFGWETYSCDVLICPDGNWYALRGNSTRWDDTFHGRVRPSIPNSSSDKDFQLEPRAFLQAAMSFACA
jgi:hypothetical protein